MKPRRLVVSLEMTTDLGLSELHSGGDWMLALADYWMPEGEPTRQCKMTPQVHQVQVNVVRAQPKPTRAERTAAKAAAVVRDPELRHVAYEKVLRHIEKTARKGAKKHGS